MEIDPARLALLADLQTSAGREAVGDLLRAYVGDTGSGLAHLRECAQSGDRATMRRLAHKLKGSSSMMGARRLTELMARIETDSADATADVTHLIDAAERALEAVLAELAAWRGDT